MTKEAFLLVLLAALLTVVANLMTRHGLVRAGGLTFRATGLFPSIVRMICEPTLVLGIVAYGLAAIVWFRVLSITEVSSAYPILVGITFMSVTVGAVLLFGESLNLIKLLGVLLILAGVVFIARA